MVLFLMGTGNMTIIYQKEIADARKKCMEAKKNFCGRDLAGKVGKDGLKPKIVG